MLNVDWILKTNLVSLKVHAAVDLSKKVYILETISERIPY